MAPLAAAAAASGILQALAFPPLGWWPLAAVALVPLLAVLGRGGKNAWRADALLGWIAASTFWFCSVPWVVHVMAHFGGLGRPTGIAIHLAMCSYLGLFGALFGVVAGRLRAAGGVLTPLALAGAWCAIEWLRGNVGMGGFPWNLTAYALAPVPVLVQSAAWIGAYGVGALLVLVNALAAELVPGMGKASARRVQARRWTAASAVLLVALVWGGGDAALQRQAEVDRHVQEGAEPAGIHVAALQPGTELEERWQRENLGAIYERVFALSREAVAAGAELVVWPESAIPLRFEAVAPYRDEVVALARAGEARIVFGSIHEEPDGRYFNSTYLLEPDGSVAARVDKHKLVPFGEYVPAAKLLSFAGPLVREVGTFTAGEPGTLLGTRPPRLGMAICYEVVFPELAARAVRSGAEVLVTITNDSWFGDGGAQRQHWNGAVLRAVESRRYLVRAATTGISGVISPAGEAVKELGMGERGVVHAFVLPRRDLTLAARLPWLVPLLGALAAAIGIIRAWTMRSANDCSP